MLYIMCISVRLYVCFIKQVTVGWCTMVVFLCLCCLCFGNSLWAFLQSVSNVLAICSQPQGSDLSCPRIRIRHAFAIRSEYIHVMFATHFVGGRCIINNPFATFWQSVRSVMANRSQPQGPIYRARIYECTHEIGNGNVYSMK